MAKTKVITLLFLAVVLLPIISSAVPIQLSVNQDIGLDISYPKYEFAKLETTFQLNIHVYNKTNGLQVTNSTTNCTLHLYLPNGNHLWDGDFSYDLDDGDFYIDINNNNFTVKGVHAYDINCQSTDIGGFVSGNFDLNSTGQELTQSRSILYIGLLAILVFMFIIDLGGITLLPSGDTKTDDGEILAINNLKYLRPVLWVFAYMILMAILFLASNISLAYLGTELIGQVMFVMFQLMGWLLIPMVIVWTLYIFVGVFKDKETKAMLERGIPVGSSV